MTNLYLIRHADYVYDLVDGAYPRRDLSLSAEGRQQAEHLRHRLATGGEIKADMFLPDNSSKWVLERFNDYHHLNATSPQ